MNGIMFMVQILIGHHVIMPTIGQLVCKCRGNRPKWLAPKKVTP